VNPKECLFTRTVTTKRDVDRWEGKVVVVAVDVAAAVDVIIQTRRGKADHNHHHKEKILHP
jgi:hypothetical protein